MTEESKEFIINKRCIGASGVVLWGGLYVKESKG